MTGFFRFILFCFLFCIPLLSFTQNKIVKGKVTDAVSHEPLPFVSITFGNNRQGATSDLDGRFTLQVPVSAKEIKFSFVGYSPLSIPLSDATFINVELSSTQYELNVVQIFPGENPAHRIIENAVSFRNSNDPLQKKSFSYTSYNKTIFTADNKNLRKADSIAGSKDTSLHNLTKFLDSSDFFIMEFVSERLYRKPGLNSETVIGSRVSGFNNPAFTILASQMQSFAFYDDLIKVGDKSYLNPISNGSTNKYFFLLEDTLYSGNDSVFIISFRPRKNKNFDAMKGLLYINSNNWAIQNVIAEPTEAQSGTTLKIQQQYELVDGKNWFPVQMNTDMTFNNAQINGSSIIALGRSYIYDIVIDSNLARNKFGMASFSVDPNAAKMKDAFWLQYRTDSLNKRDLNTYIFMDSIGKKENFDRRFRNMETFILGKIPWKIFEIDILRLFEGNDYEGFCTTLDVHTNNKLSQWFALGGFYGYGFKDKAFKYGYDAWIRLWKPRDVRFSFKYKNDVTEKGEIKFPFSDESFFSSSFSSGAYRDYLMNDMDQIQSTEIAVSSHLLKCLKIRASLAYNDKTVTNSYQYIYPYENVSVMLNNYSFSEFSVGFRFAWREEFMENFNTRLSMGTRFPIVTGQYTRGLGDNIPVNLGAFSGNFEYNRFDLSVDKTFTIKNFGRTMFRAQSGFIEGDVPLCNLYNAPASFRPMTILPANSFTTMRMNEFFCDRYAALFFIHNFGRLLMNKKHFRPDILVAHNMMFGDMTNVEKHTGQDFQIPSLGYHETGIILNNLFRINYLGLGFGTYLRHGAYALPELKNNLAYRFSFTFVL